MNLLAESKNEGLTLRSFNGAGLSEQKIGYNKSLKEFLRTH